MQDSEIDPPIDHHHFDVANDLADAIYDLLEKKGFNVGDVAGEPDGEDDILVTVSGWPTITVPADSLKSMVIDWSCEVGIVLAGLWPSEKAEEAKKKWQL